MKNKSNFIKKQFSLADKLSKEFKSKWQDDPQNEIDNANEMYSKLKNESSSHKNIKKIRDSIHKTKR